MSPCVDCPAAAELAYLRSELAIQVEATAQSRVFEHFGLSYAQGLVVMALYSAKGRVLSAFQLEEATRLRGGRERAVKTLEVVVHNTRERIGRDAIITCPGFGYRLSPDAIERVAEIMLRT